MSVFTYDPNPPRVSSPWLPLGDAVLERQPRVYQAEGPALADGDTTVHSRLSSTGVARLPPEPQEGPIEYKLHLLLRPRRAYMPQHPSTSKTASAAGSSDSFGSSGSSASADPRHLPRTRILGSSTADETRQDRCQHLMTQLLWRLRQSSPYHASVAHHQNMTVPLLPADAALATRAVTLGQLAPGLEESRGALYELGVADDGTLVGIAKDEMDQSVATLRWMAAHLGCVCEIQRMVAVGACRYETAEEESGQDRREGRETLWVAEIFVRPSMSVRCPSGAELSSSAVSASLPPPASPLATLGSATTNQLRVTLTGPTGSGKSTLLGTLSTGALDDGHGKSRLNSLRHRHELASGLTSTVTQELLGYGDDDSIVNYANANIESWIGIHDYTKDGRLVFISDSAGHPRFRRTTLRSLIGWAPHWTLLCLGAAVEPSSPDAPDGSTALGRAHLDLCLKLDLPLAIVLTKSDLLTKESLKRTLVPIWTAVKRAGRTPQLLQSRQRSPEHVRAIVPADAAAIREALAHRPASAAHLGCRATVPVILTSAVSGDGIGLVHALLRALPLPPTPTAQDYVGMALNPEEPAALFHIEDRFSRPAASYASASPGQLADPGHVVSGYLRFGSVSVGDTVVLGPFPSSDEAAATDDAGEAGEAGEASTPEDAAASVGSHGGLSLPSSGAELAHLAVSASAVQGEWHTARIVSIRNLRLPVDSLQAGQVGTIGLVMQPAGRGDKADDCLVVAGETPPLQSTIRSLRPRRGMVLAVPSKHMTEGGQPSQSQSQSQLQLQAASELTAFFADPAVASLAIGTPVTFYVASVRAQARICRIWSAHKDGYDDDGADDALDAMDAMDAMDGDVLGLHEPSAHGAGQSAAVPGYHVRLELLYGREWIELGSQIVLLEGASREASLLDAFIGKVVEISD